MDQLGKVALIAGRGTALETACAAELIRTGYSVVRAMTVSDAPMGASELDGSPVVDLVANASSAQAVVEQARVVHGRLDALVVFDPSVARGNLRDLSAAAWNADLERLHTSVCVATAFSSVAETGSAIVMLTTIDHAQAYPGRGPSAATAAATVGVCRAMAVEWAGRPIRVNVVATGVVLTEEDQRAIDHGDRSLERVLLRAPNHRLGDVEETARVVRFLLSDQAAFITGQTVSVDGGWTTLTQHAEGLRFP